MKTVSIGHFYLHGPISVMQFSVCWLLLHLGCTVCSSTCYITPMRNQTWCPWALRMVTCSSRERRLFEKPLWKYPCPGPWGCTGILTMYLLILTFLWSRSYGILLIIFFFRTDEMNSLAGCKHLLNSADGATSECLQVNWWNRGTAFIFLSIGNEKYVGQKYMGYWTWKPQPPCARELVLGSMLGTGSSFKCVCFCLFHLFGFWFCLFFILLLIIEALLKLKSKWKPLVFKCWKCDVFSWIIPYQ